MAPEKIKTYVGNVKSSVDKNLDWMCDYDDAFDMQVKLLRAIILYCQNRLYEMQRTKKVYTRRKDKTRHGSSSKH